MNIVPKLTLTFDPVTQINRVPLLITNNSHMKFERWLGKNCSLYRAHKVSLAECQRWPRPLIPWSKINRVPSLITNISQMKFERDWAKTVVCILSTRFHSQGMKVDLDYRQSVRQSTLDLWPGALYQSIMWSIGFLLSSSKTYVWFDASEHMYIVNCKDIASKSNKESISN